MAAAHVMHDGLPDPNDIVADKYVVDRVLGRGGMGEVYAVTHRLTGKRLALKCLLPSYWNSPSAVERFLREARAAGRIQHRHVIDVFDAGRDGDLLYLVMPLLEGKPLSELLQDERLTLEETLLILVRAMEGVAAAHDCGVLHRDLKPGNIFVCVGVTGRLDDPRVLDFGISKFDDEVASPLTHSGMAVGTPYYMALEQLVGRRDIDQRVDVYSLGVILYEAIAGVTPHAAENVAALAIRLMHIPPTHLSALRPDLPAGLADAVMRALARDRDCRYPSVRALIEAVAPFAPESTGLSTAEPQGTPLRTPRDAAPVPAPHLVHPAATTAPSTPTPVTPPERVEAPPRPSSLPVGAGSRSASRTVRLATIAAVGVVAAIAWAMQAAKEQVDTSPYFPRSAPPAMPMVSGDASRAVQAPAPRFREADDAKAEASPPRLDGGSVHVARPQRKRRQGPALARATSAPSVAAAVDAGQLSSGASVAPQEKAVPIAPAGSPPPELNRAGTLAPDEF